MVNMTFIGQSVPGIRRKLQRLDGALGLNPSQLVDIVFKVYHAQVTRKLNQVGKPDREVGLKRKRERPTRLQSMCLLQGGGGPSEKGLLRAQKEK